MTPKALDDWPDTKGTPGTPAPGPANSGVPGRVVRPVPNGAETGVTDWAPQLGGTASGPILFAPANIATPDPAPPCRGVLTAGITGSRLGTDPAISAAPTPVALA